MKRYFLRRLLLLLPTLIGALSLVFVLIHLIPGDPVEIMLGESATATDKEELRRNLGFDQPLSAQYRTFLLKLTTGDLGRSLYEQASVSEIIAARLPATLQLAIAALIMAILIAFPLAIMASVYCGAWIDRAALWFSLLGLSLPNFWLGPSLMILFSIQLGWLPVSGRGGFGHLVLPALTLGLGMAAILTRILRASLLQAMREDFVQTRAPRQAKRVWLSTRCCTMLSVTDHGPAVRQFTRGLADHGNDFWLARPWPFNHPGDSHPRLSLGARLRARDRGVLCVGQFLHRCFLQTHRPAHQL
jgi:ABC-type dipeptide/oligopeptide/nickel transport system permease component